MSTFKFSFCSGNGFGSVRDGVLGTGTVGGKGDVQRTRVGNDLEFIDNTEIFNVGIGGCKLNGGKQGDVFKGIKGGDKTLHKGFV
jgi:hypothetical protein